jgi:hypothetical protein
MSLHAQFVLPGDGLDYADRTRVGNKSDTQKVFFPSAHKAAEAFGSDTEPRKDGRRIVSAPERDYFIRCCRT